MEEKISSSFKKFIASEKGLETVSPDPLRSNVAVHCMAISVFRRDVNKLFFTNIVILLLHNRKSCNMFVPDHSKIYVKIRMPVKTDGNNIFNLDG
jgi:hypothetical protein